MRDALKEWRRGFLWIGSAVLLQSFLGRWVLGSRVFPEADLALLVLFAFTLGEKQGSFLGLAAGLLRDSLASTPFGITAAVFSGIGFLSGMIGAGRPIVRWPRPLLVVFLGVFFSDTCFLLLKGGSPPVRFSLLGYYRESVLPSAFLSTAAAFLSRPLFGGNEKS